MQSKRKAIADEIRSSYESNTSLVVHWDGKQSVSRWRGARSWSSSCHRNWPTKNCAAKLLGTTKLPAGTGQTIANAIMECLEDWQSGNCQIIWLGWSFISCPVTMDQHLMYVLLQKKTGTPTLSFSMPPSLSGASGRASIHYELWPVFWSWRSQIQAFPIKLEFHWPKQVWAIDA